MYSYPEVEFGLFVDSIGYISMYSRAAEWWSTRYSHQLEVTSTSRDTQPT